MGQCVALKIDIDRPITIHKFDLPLCIRIVRILAKNDAHAILHATCCGLDAQKAATQLGAFDHIRHVWTKLEIIFHLRVGTCIYVCVLCKLLEEGDSACTINMRLTWVLHTSKPIAIQCQRTMHNKTDTSIQMSPRALRELGVVMTARHQNLLEGTKHLSRL